MLYVRVNTDKILNIKIEFGINSLSTVKSLKVYLLKQIQLQYMEG